MSTTLIIWMVPLVAAAMYLGTAVAMIVQAIYEAYRSRRTEA